MSFDTARFLWKWFQLKILRPKTIILTQSYDCFLQKYKLLFASSVYIVPPRRSYGLGVTLIARGGMLFCRQVGQLK